ncbi:MAG: RNA polymerase sigma-70 factor [Saprospiraceae bacterium]|nr:RNA polymerase sigma-70 factor [Saprospiraceae bacterium]
MESLYGQFYEKLCNQVYFILHDSDIAEDIVQEVFVEIWKKREDLNVLLSIEAYLKRACRNRALNFIRDNHIKWEEESTLVGFEDAGFTTDQYLSAEELNIKIQRLISDLPEKCGIIFSLSRYEDMSYSEIASELNISVKTVENQISKALKVLRSEIYKKTTNE